MRFKSLVILVGAAFMLTATPAQAQWRDYVSHDFGIAFHAPGELTVENGTYQADTTGEHRSIVYRSMADDIEYKVIVTDFRHRSEEGASLLEEAAFVFQNGGSIVSDTYSRVETVYGRKVTIDLPNDGGRSMASFYFDRGYLFQLVATVLPANGDYGSPNLSRFLVSLVFGENRIERDATVLGLPN